MSGEFWIVNSELTKKAFCVHVDKLFLDNKHITFRWRIGADRSFDQNALFHVWCSEWIADKLKKSARAVTEAELEGMKRTVKKLYYQYSQAEFMIHEICDYSRPKKGGGYESKKDYTSSKSWKRGEMFDVLTFMQIAAAEQGVVLEAKGEFAKLKREQVA